jgi:hypothetical protein
LLGEGFSFGAFNTDFLAGGAGPSMLVLQTEDADGDRARYAADGIAVGAGAHRIEVLTPAAAGRLGLTPDLSRGPRFIGARVAAAAPPAPRTAPDPAHGLLIDWRTAG